jgi:hypothetical protein
LGEKFGGNAPLFAAALNDTHAGEIDVTLIGAMGHGELLPIFQAALGAKTKRLLTLVAPACSTCLEFTDGKVMLSDMAACAEIIWERLIDCVGQSVLDSELKTARFISAVNWSKLPYAGVIWSKLADRLAELAALLRSRIAVDRVIIHPNDDAACASAARTVYVPGADENSLWRQAPPPWVLFLRRQRPCCKSFAIRHAVSTPVENRLALLSKFSARTNPSPKLGQAATSHLPAAVHTARNILGTIVDKQVRLRALICADTVFVTKNLNTHYRLYLQPHYAHSRSKTKRSLLA